MKWYKVDQEVFSFIFTYFNGKLPEGIKEGKDCMLVSQQFVDKYKEEIDNYILSEIWYDDQQRYYE